MMIWIEYIYSSYTTCKMMSVWFSGIFLNRGLHLSPGRMVVTEWPLNKTSLEQTIRVKRSYPPKKKALHNCRY